MSRGIVCPFGLLSVAMLLALHPGRAPADEPSPALLFDSGKDGYARYRIPALLLTPKGTLLAFCEGRKDGRGLTGDIDIVLKRSADGGKSWQALQVVADDGPHTLGNPCAVIDRRDGTIWLALTRSDGRDTEDAIVAGTARGATRVHVTRSDDDGATWSPLRDISATARDASWTWYGTGPGVGVQLKSGRLVIPCYHAEAGTRTYRSHVIYSDDHGKTWRRGGSVGEDCSECQAAERADASLVLSARTLKGTPRRTTALSKDGGQTWSTVGRDEALYDPSCQASLLRLGAGPWLYCHPAGPEGRRNLTIRLSRDEGRTWPVGRRLRSGDGQYSCLAPLPDGDVGCLFESWVAGNYRLYFARFGLDWLNGGAQPRRP